MDFLQLSKSLGRTFMRLSGITWRIRYTHPPGPRTGHFRGTPVLYAFWHGRQLPLIHTHRNEGITVLVSMNTDGQYATNVLHTMGFETVRGSTSRGGMKAIGEMVSLLRSGRDCAITPDGPRGPIHRSSGGPGIISRLSGSFVVPMGTSAWPAVRFRSWDRFVLPLPFSKVTVSEGRAIPPMRKGDDGTWREMLETGLRMVTAAADLSASPAASIQYAVVVGLLRTAGLAAAVTLRFRPHRERNERSGRIQRQTDAPIWLHGSSLGELTGLMPFIEEARKLGAGTFVTCSTPAGRKFIEEKGLRGSFAPLDDPVCVNRFLEAIGPSGLVLAETELWPCTLMASIDRSIPCMLVNGRLSSSSLSRYMLMKPLLGRILSCFTGILTRSPEDTERFSRLGADPDIITTTSDAKACYDPGDPPEEWRRLLFDGSPVLVAGSTRRGEEVPVIRAALSAGFMPVLAPRHLDRVREVADILRSEGLSPVLWSELSETEGGSRPDSVVVDSHGILSRLYGSADTAFVGGTLVDMGGHNVLEPLQRGVPVVVGPYCNNFAELVRDGTGAGVVKQVTDTAGLAQALTSMRMSMPSPEIVRAIAEPSGIDPLALFRRLLILSGAVHPSGGPVEKT